MHTLLLMTTVSEGRGAVVLSSLRMDSKNTIDIQIPFSPAFVAYASLHVPYINRLANDAQRQGPIVTIPASTLPSQLGSVV
jgi:hypothetical protein